MAREDERHPVRFPIRRATASEAAGARRMIEQTFTDRVSWVAARVLLERCLPVIEQLSEQADVDTADLQQSMRHFLERHPAPATSRGRMVFPGGQGEDPTAGVCRSCQEIAHDKDCPLVGDGRPVDG